MARTTGHRVVQPAGAPENEIRECSSHQAAFPEDVASKVWKDKQRKGAECGRADTSGAGSRLQVGFCVEVAGRVGRSRAAQCAGAQELEGKSWASPATRCPHCPARRNSSFCFVFRVVVTAEVTISLCLFPERSVTGNFLRAPSSDRSARTFLFSSTEELDSWTLGGGHLPRYPFWSCMSSEMGQRSHI